MANTNQLDRLLLAAKEDISIAEATRRNNSLEASVKITDFGSFKVKQRSDVCQGKPYSTKEIKFKPFEDLSNRVK